MTIDSSEPSEFHVLVSREEWGARQAKTIPRLKHPVPCVRYTHTNTEECCTECECLVTVRSIQLHHMQQGFNDIKYNFLVGGDGRIYEGRGWYFEAETPKHYKADKKQTIDFAFIGKYMGDKTVDQKMIDVARGVVQWGIRRKMFKIPFDVEEYYDEV